jgi:hypothetical protein
MRLRLIVSRQGDQLTTTLLANPVQGMDPAADDDSGGWDDKSLVLWRWSGGGRFEYLADDGEWLQRWPPDATAAREDAVPRLPAAVRLLGPPNGALVVPMVSDLNPLISRRQAWEADDARR